MVGFELLADSVQLSPNGSLKILELGCSQAFDPFSRHCTNTMLIKIGYDISLRFPVPTTVVHLLHVHPSRRADLIAPEQFLTEPAVPIEQFYDSSGNHLGRISAPAGTLRLLSEAVIRDSGAPDVYAPNAAQLDVSEIPTGALAYLRPSRYCEVDSQLMDFAWTTFSKTRPGWDRVQAICDFVHGHLRFDYQNARADRTALDAFREQVGVCRDFTHLAITLCRCLNVPARYATGYLGDIGVPAAPYPMDFSAWFEVYLQGQWYTFDARHNRRRIGRVLIGLGRDAADVPITTSFGKQSLEVFRVITDEIDSAAISGFCLKHPGTERSLEFAGARQYNNAHRHPGPQSRCP
jgi:transglutaminase-like putative cysteine protease